VIDPPLSPLGEAQADHLGTHFAPQIENSKERVRLFTSSMTRAMQTIRPLAQALSLNPVVHPDLYEVKGFYHHDPGSRQHGPTREEIGAKFPGWDTSLIPDGGQGKETMEDAWLRIQRVAEWLRKMAVEKQVDSSTTTNGPPAKKQRREEDTVIIVAHNDFLGLLAKQLLVPSARGPSCLKDLEGAEDLFTESYWSLNNTGICHIVLGVEPPKQAYQVEAYLLYWNRSDHLSEELRTGIPFVNIGFSGAAAWARIGKGGTDVTPVFSEHKVVKPCPPPAEA